MINKTLIIGNMCADPEQRFGTNGNAVASFTVATTEKWKDQSGQQQEETEFHKCVAFGKLAEIIAQYSAKGNRVYCSGRLKTRKWKDQSGADRWTTEHIVKEFKNLSPRNQDSGGGSSSYQEPPPGFLGDTGEDVPF